MWIAGGITKLELCHRPHRPGLRKMVDCCLCFSTLTVDASLSQAVVTMLIVGGITTPAARANLALSLC